jgi:hypothetical protein
LIFVSYAERDGSEAARVVTALRDSGLEVYDWRENNGTRFMDQINEKIKEAEAFLALMSPNFQESPWCRREVERALTRDNVLLRGPSWPFIYILPVGHVREDETGFLSSYGWFPLGDVQGAAEKLAALNAELKTSGHGDEKKRKDSSAALDIYSFRNRQEELERVNQELQSLSGTHFWLVVAPPQLGKTHFIDQVGLLASQHARPWVIRLADIREYPPDRRHDVGMILAELFGKNRPVATDTATIRLIALEIIGDRRQHLCLLDGAELLDRSAATELRSCLSQIYDHIRNSRDPRARLALIVASRRDDEWRGVTPVPRLKSVRLTEFKQVVVEEALRDLAERMERDFASAVGIRHAPLVQELTEGLPALLVACLEWIREDQWVQLNRWINNNRPADPVVFTQLAHPYIEKGLLSQDGLMPGIREGLQERMVALEHTFRVLTPYRFLTMSHLRHHLIQDEALSDAMAQAGWELEELWQAISGTALLSRPLDEPWTALDATVRRLLFRYFYTSDAEKVGAHQRALAYVQEWVSGQTGPEQVIGRIECLWHQAEMLRLTSPEEMRTTLSNSARAMFDSLQPSTALSETELRSFGARRIREDDELAGTLSASEGLLDEITDIAEGRRH